jgi:cytidylate kinase
VTRPRPLIAIDGPAGSGKSTLARRLAEELDLPYVNTGLMYRWLTLRAVEEGVDPDDEDGLGALAGGITFELNESVRPAELLIDGRIPGPEVTSPEVESRVSRVSRHPRVREVLRAAQRRLCEGGGVVEGRDIGSVVAPRADAKIYLEADEDERVTRRTGERAASGASVGRDLAERDALDARTNPPEPAADAVAIDTTSMDADLVLRIALAVVRAKLSERGW